MLVPHVIQHERQTQVTKLSQLHSRDFWQRCINCYSLYHCFQLDKTTSLATKRVVHKQQISVQVLTAWVSIMGLALEITVCT